MRVHLVYLEERPLLRTSHLPEILLLGPALEMALNIVLGLKLVWTLKKGYLLLLED
jgi:hypothetical protein